MRQARQYSRSKKEFYETKGHRAGVAGHFARAPAILSTLATFAPLDVGGEPLVRCRELGIPMPKLSRLGLEMQVVASAVGHRLGGLIGVSRT